MDNIRKGKYGLVFLPKNKSTNEGVADPAFELGKQKIEQQLAKRGNVFGDDDDESSSGNSSEDEHDTKAPKKKLAQVPTNFASVQQKQSKQVMKKALEDDPNVYEYDEIYDDMQENTRLQKEKEKASVDKKPKYIDNLLKTAARRQREYEARVERDVQKEREKEGDEFKDKEEFVTSAYRKKMEELQRIKEEEERQDAIDNLVDVTKQKDLSGFYRHLYRETVTDRKEGTETVTDGKEEAEAETGTDIKEEKETVTARKEETETDQYGDDSTKRYDESRSDRHRDIEKYKGRDQYRDDSRRHGESRSDRYRDSEKYKGRDQHGDDSRRRHGESRSDRHRDNEKYRGRDQHGDDSRRRYDESRSDRHRDRGRDQYADDSRRRYDESRSDRHRDNEKHRGRDKEEERPRKRDADDNCSRTDRTQDKEKENREDRGQKSTTKDNQDKSDKGKEVKTEEEKEEKPPKVSIWAKRTVGNVLEEAKARYLERKGTLQVAIVKQE